METSVLATENTMPLLSSINYFFSFYFPQKNKIGFSLSLTKLTLKPAIAIGEKYGDNGVISLVASASGN